MRVLQDWVSLGGSHILKGLYLGPDFATFYVTCDSDAMRIDDLVHITFECDQYLCLVVPRLVFATGNLERRILNLTVQ